MDVEHVLSDSDISDNGEELINEKNVKYKPRAYQYEMLQYIIKQNTLVYLPTGSGKTYIAVLAIQYFGKQLEPRFSEGGKRTVFLINTVVLVSQQAKYIEKLLPYKVGSYSGDMNVDTWNRQKWREEFENNQIIVSTTQIIVDIIRAGFVKISDFNLMIFDECHHATGDHPMHQLMSQFENIPAHYQPRVVGLTGMLVASTTNKENIVPHIKALENTFNAVVRTVNSHDNLKDVLCYSTKAVEGVLIYSQPEIKLDWCEHSKLLVKQCDDLIAEWPMKLKSPHIYLYHSSGGKDWQSNTISKLKTIINDFPKQLDELGIFGGFIAARGVTVELELKRRESKSASHKHLISVLISKMNLISHILNEAMSDVTSSIEKILRYSSLKVIQLFVYLEEYLQQNYNDEMKCLIFTQKQRSAKCLYHILRLYALDNPLFKLKPDFIVGQQNKIPESIESMLENKWRRRAMDRFETNEINCLVATSVLEEGVDMQTCNLVISFDFPSTFRSYIQSKGRARCEKSNYVLMIPKSEEAKYCKKLTVYKEIDAELKNYLIGKTINRAEPSKIDVDAELYQHDIKPFYSRSGAKLEVSSAISLLNRYCHMLPHDEFSLPTIIWKAINANSNKVFVSIKLPMQSIHKHEIMGIPHSSLKIAKRFAAFNACKILYEKGELNEHLLPVSAVNWLTTLNNMYFSHWTKYDEDDLPENAKIVGTRKISRMYKIKYPKQLNDCSPNCTQRNYLYKIQIKSVNLFQCKEDEYEANSKCKELLMNNQTYAICTTKLIPKLPAFKLYLSFCDIDVEISDNPFEVVFESENDIQLLRRYHVMIFKNILNVAKSFLAYNNYESCNSYLIVPMIGNKIDWKLVVDFQNMSKPRELTVFERQQMSFNQDDYLYKIVTPWYRTDNESRYIVTNVVKNVTPCSSFPKDGFDTFEIYFNQQYNLQVLNQNQFLIKVKGLTSKLNRLHPIEDKPKNRKPAEILVPEFCYNFMFPGCMWMKAILLPSILHRLQFMLNAENLRVSLNRFVNVHDQKYVPENLDVDKTNITDETDKMLKSISSSTAAFLSITSKEELNPNKIKHSNFISAFDLLDAPWRIQEEPIDLERNLDAVSTEDLDFYHAFISRPLNNLKLNSKAGENYDSNDTTDCLKLPNSKRQAICHKAKPTKIRLLQLNDMKSIKLKNLIKAITAASSTDVFDMERYELLGDSYLKMIISIYLYFQYPDWHEGYLTAVRGQIVSNRNLLYCGIEKGLPEIMKILPFNPKNDWIPPSFMVPKEIKQYMNHFDIPSSYLYKLDISNDEVVKGNVDKSAVDNFLTNIMLEKEITDDSSSLNNFLMKQNIRDKAISDCVEAILGVCVENFGIKTSIKFMNYFNIIPHNIDHLFDKARPSSHIDKNTFDADIDRQIFKYREIENILGYTYNERQFLLQALTHTSYLSNRVTESYQELEFLGDSILDFLITAYIYENGGNLNPGELTDIRSALVNNATLACITVRKKLHRHMLYQNAQLAKSINNFYDYQAKHNFKITDEIELLNTECDLKIAGFIDVPKCLGDIFESLIGSIYVDSNKNLNVVWNVIYNFMKTEIHEFMVNVPKQVVRRLYEYPKANPTFNDPIIVASTSQVFVTVRFYKLDKMYEVTGFGQNKQEAKQAAAKYALQILINQ